MWTCKSCHSADYVLCKKCYQIGRIEHPKSLGDHREGQKHDFEISKDAMEEFESDSSTISSVKAPSVNGSKTDTENEQEDISDEKEADEELTTGVDDLRYEVDDIGELEFPDLDQLRQLDELL